MNDKCNRKCHWIYNGGCVAEICTHITDGTVYTANCSMFIEKSYFKRFEKTLVKCRRSLNHMSYAELRKAKYLLSHMEDFFKAKKLQNPISPEWVARIQYTKDDYMDDYRCTVCGFGVAEDYSHCPHCGQALDWIHPIEKNVQVKDIKLNIPDPVEELLAKILEKEERRFEGAN